MVERIKSLYCRALLGDGIKKLVVNIFEMNDVAKYNNLYICVNKTQQNKAKKTDFFFLGIFKVFRNFLS